MEGRIKISMTPKVGTQYKTILMGVAKNNSNFAEIKAILGSLTYEMVINE